MEHLVSKFLEEKENLALSLSDRLSKHKIAKIASDIEQMNKSQKTSYLKAQVQFDFKERIAELDHTLQRTKEENRELKERIATLLNQQKQSEPRNVTIAESQSTEPLEL